MRPPRGLSPKEASAWAKLAATVEPLPGRAAPALIPEPVPAAPSPLPASAAPVRKAQPSKAPAALASRPPAPATGSMGTGLDSHWDRRIARGGLEPDFTLDLHGHTLDTAFHRLGDGLAQARAMRARVVLLIAGKPRPVEAADRGSRRGAIRAKLLDWLAAGPHATHIAAIRKAHVRHGGEGALYVVLRRR